MTTCVVLVTYTSTAPLVPAGTIAALATIWPLSAFRVETRGWMPPAGHVVRYPRIPDGTTVMFSEYAAALDGSPHAPCDSGKDLSVPPVRTGPPNGPAGFRVSTTRHGITV